MFPWKTRMETFPRIPFSAAAVVSLLFFQVAGLKAAPSSKINRRAQAIAKLIAPVAPAKKFDSGSLGKLEKQMSQAIELMEDSYRTSGPSPGSLLDKAFEFREDIAQVEEMILHHSLLNAWREANAAGLFDRLGKFSPKASQGRGVGDRFLFEYIIPGEVYPEASNQLSNIRLVRESEKRADSASLTPRETAFRNNLEKMISEKLEGIELANYNNGPKTNSLGQTDEQHSALWNKEMELAGEAANELPNLRVEGHVSATPTHATKDRWRVECDITNISRIPTEVKVEIWLLGYTEEKRIHYLMAKSEHQLKLRSGENRVFEVFTKSQRSYKQRADDADDLSKKERQRSKVKFRGYVIRVTHEKGIAGLAGNDRTMLRYADPKDETVRVESLPQF